MENAPSAGMENAPGGDGKRARRVWESDEKAPQRVSGRLRPLSSRLVLGGLF